MLETLHLNVAMRSLGGCFGEISHSVGLSCVRCCMDVFFYFILI